MKIAMVSEHASPLADLGGAEAGGQNVHVAELSAALARRGHDVTVYTRRDDPRAQPEVFTGAGYRVVHVQAGPPHPLPKDRILPFLGQFGGYLQREWADDAPHLVHAHFWMSGLASELAARTHGIPVVQTFHALGIVQHRHEGLADTSPRSRIRFERLIAARAAHVVATCSDELVELTRMGVPRYRISVVPSGVDLSRFTPNGPFDHRTLPHRIVSVGQLVRRKGFDAVIRALPELPDTELVIVGGSVGDDVDDQSELRRLRRIAMEHGVHERVRLLGRLSRGSLPWLLRSADAVVCTPWYEPFGMVALEAMACGKPVVSTAVGSMLDTVVDGVTGRLVPRPDPSAIARAVRPLLEDTTLRDTWGAAGYRRAHDNFSWDRVAEDTLIAYHRGAPARTGNVALRAR
ncbi:glycosyltransferase [Nocardia sp. GCM10030253]|uniref:glycosyltransferase n=1 Tax=Nocardia sp. GCM10030253 TaxID=3273404 RepID=UPI003634539F